MDDVSLGEPLGDLDDLNNSHVSTMSALQPRVTGAMTVDDDDDDIQDIEQDSGDNRAIALPDDDDDAPAEPHNTKMVPTSNTSYSELRAIHEECSRMYSAWKDETEHMRSIVKQLLSSTSQNSKEIASLKSDLAIAQNELTTTKNELQDLRSANSSAQTEAARSSSRSARDADITNALNANKELASEISKLKTEISTLNRKHDEALQKMAENSKAAPPGDADRMARIESAMDALGGDEKILEDSINTLKRKVTSLEAWKSVVDNDHSEMMTWRTRIEKKLNLIGESVIQYNTMLCNLTDEVTKVVSK